MDNTTIGAIIATLRYEKKYSRKQLCQGLCSTQMLIKIEKNEADVDKFLLDMLLQRLGKSSDKLEMILSDTDYERIYLRDRMEELIWKEKKEEVTALLEEYENRYAKGSNVEKMFVLRTRAYMNRNLEHDIKTTEIYIRQAIETTLPGINSKNLREYLLAENEVENILELGRCLLEQDKNVEAEELLIACQKYIDMNITDEMEYAKLNSKSSWLRSQLYVKKGVYMQAYQVCEVAMEGLQKYGILHFMIPLLEQLIFCGSQLEMDLNRDKWKIYYDILKKLYQDYGETWHCHDALFHNCYQTVYHLASEFIRQERQVRKLTQEELIQSVYDVPENLSRVEHGKAMPTKRKFEGLMDNLGIERGKYCGTVIVENLEILELKYKIDIFIGEGKYEEAQVNLNKLQESLDCNKKINGMAVEIYQTMIDTLANKIDAKTTYENLRRLLEKSFLLENERLYRVPFYNELLALNMISISLRKMGKGQESIAIYKDIIRAVEESKVDARYQNEIISLTLANLDLVDSEKKWFDMGVSYELSCGKGKMIYMHFVSQIELMESEEARREMTRQAYYMCDMFFREKNKQSIKAYYEQTYGEILL